MSPRNAEQAALLASEGMERVFIGKRKLDGAMVRHIEAKAAGAPTTSQPPAG